MLYILKRFDESVAMIDFVEDGSVKKFRINPENEDLAPVHAREDHQWLKKWWKRRSVPLEQGRIQQMLRHKGFSGTEEYLIRNLGLSLTDYYWVSPIDSELQWKDVNLFENEFHGDIWIGESEEIQENEILRYSPNSSLQGTLEKSWTIINGERCLLKGNCNEYSAESINEVIASKLHQLQEFANYTDYQLVKVKGREYEYGCYSKLFTSLKYETVSAFDMVISEKQQNDRSSFEHFIHVCGKNGMDQEKLRQFLDYQILSDFVLSNRDRHLGNISLMRDAKTLQFTQAAPIYDTGKSLFVQETVPTGDRELLNIKTNSFAGSEWKLLQLVTDRKCLDCSKLPDRAYIEEIYGLDSHMSTQRIRQIGEAYERKIALLERFQTGQDLNPIRLAIRGKGPSSV